MVRSAPNGVIHVKKNRHQTQDILRKITSLENLAEACKKVVKNDGGPGIDGMTVDDLKRWFANNWQTLQKAMLNGTYKPKPTKGIKIPKPKGGERLLGIPTVIDRLVQQAIAQILQTIYDPTFSKHSYGFRPKRNAHHALLQATKCVCEGKSKVIDLDLENFFGEVNHQRLLATLRTRIGDKRLIWILNLTLKTGILLDGVLGQQGKGTPQGSPLSPLLSNIVLDELDQELQRRGLSFSRYADDIQIFVKSQVSSERVFGGIINFIEKKMRLKVNKRKSSVSKPWEVNFLGHNILSGGRVGLSKDSEAKLKWKLREITKRKREAPIKSILQQIGTTLTGWMQYFKYASMKSKLTAIDGWLRRRIRCIKLRQCKRCFTVVKFLRQLNVEETLAWRTALSGKSRWRISKSPALSIGMSVKWFLQQGYYNILENYSKLHSNPL